MTEYEILNLDKIRDNLSSFNDLQSVLNILHTISDEFNNNSSKLDENKFSNEFSVEFKEIKKSIYSLINSILPVTEKNILLFNEFQNDLLAKFKKSFNGKLKRLELTQGDLQRYGNNLIADKKVSKIISDISFIHSLRLSQWLELIDSLKQNSIFNKIIQKVDVFYQDLIEKKLNKQLSMIKEDVDESDINEYIKAFYEQPNISFSEYQHLYKPSLNKEELEREKNKIEKEREKVDLERLKQNQEKQDQLYQDYLRLPSKEFERKRRKERRGKLSKIDLKNNEIKKIEISKEVEEKIEKFKNSFDKSLRDKYLIEEKEDKTPIELIRERKKKKSEEFKEYKKHFETE